MARFTDPIESTRKARRKVAESVESVTNEVAKHLPTPSMPDLDPRNLDPNKPIDAFFDGMKSVVEVQRTVTKKAVGTPVAFVKGAAENVGKLQERGKERVDEVVSGLVGRKPADEPKAAPVPLVKTEPKAELKTEAAPAAKTEKPKPAAPAAKPAAKPAAPEKPKPAAAAKPAPAAKKAEPAKKAAVAKAPAAKPAVKKAAPAATEGVSVAAAVAAVPTATVAAPTAAPVGPKKRNYRLMNSNQLRKACERLGLDQEGTLDELRARLQAADEAAGA
ncbi:MAG: SAP domain-containing protein [Dermatophilus congolensis]|nr:SAP domain-containing protein [Dermatophilus congolensis]